MKRTIAGSILIGGLLTINCVEVPNDYVRDNPQDSSGVDWFPPSVQVSPERQLVAVGEDAVVVAQGTDNWGIIWYRWSIDGEDQTTVSGDTLRFTCTKQETHTVRCFVIDNEGVSSKVATAFVMARDKAPLIFSPQPDAVLESNSALLQWDWGVYYHHYQVLADTVNPPVAVVNASTRDTFSMASNLVFNKSYWWMVVGFDGAGASASSEVWKFTTPENPPVPAGRGSEGGSSHL